MKATDRGIFLQRITFSDSSLITTFYTHTHGLQKFVFKGGKKKSHNLFPLSISELTYYGRKESELLNLTQVESAYPLTFQFNPVKGAIAFFMAETLEKCIGFGQADAHLYGFLEQIILQLEKQEELTLFPLDFFLLLSEALGFLPLIEDNNACVFNVDAGEFQLSQSVADRNFRGKAVDLIKDRLTGITDGVYDRKAREEALEIMMMYYQIHMPRFNTLESFEIVREVLHA